MREIWKVVYEHLSNIHVVAWIFVVISVMLVLYLVFRTWNLRKGPFFRAKKYIERRSWAAIELNHPANMVFVITKHPIVPTGELFDCISKRLSLGVKYVYMHSKEVDSEELKNEFDVEMSGIVTPQVFADCVEMKTVHEVDEELWDKTPTLVVFAWGDGAHEYSRADLFAGRDPIAAVPRVFRYPSAEHLKRCADFIKKTRSRKYAMFANKLQVR